MLFYLSPPTWIIPYRKLEDYAVKRLQFLLRLNCCHNEEDIQEVVQDAAVVDQSDCLISGSSKDIISHFTLCLSLCDNTDTKNFFCEAELALCKLRLKEMNRGEWALFLNKTHQKVRRILDTASPATDSWVSDLDFFLVVLKEEVGKGSWQKVADEITCSSTSQSVCVPFQLALGPVASRDVLDLSMGIARVPLYLVTEIITELFERSIKSAVLRANAQGDDQDTRIRRLSVVLKRIYKIETRASTLQSWSPYSPQPITLITLGSQVELFPPCMSNLMKVLATRHRLRHHDRIQLTLFLKELGLSVHEALLFWKREYSKPACHPADPSSRGWHGNERRYIYSIRHLYGLEGARKDYRGHSCVAIQGRSLSLNECGGCPFSSLDQSQVANVLTQAGVGDKLATLVLEQTQLGRYGTACSVYMKAMMQLKLLKERKPDTLMAPYFGESNKAHTASAFQPGKKAARCSTGLYNKDEFILKERQCSTCSLNNCDGSKCHFRDKLCKRPNGGLSAEYKPEIKNIKDESCTHECVTCLEPSCLLEPKEEINRHCIDHIAPYTETEVKRVGFGGQVKVNHGCVRYSQKVLPLGLPVPHSEIDDEVCKKEVLIPARLCSLGKSVDRLSCASCEEMCNVKDSSRCTEKCLEAEKQAETSWTNTKASVGITHFCSNNKDLEFHHKGLNHYTLTENFYKCCCVSEGVPSSKLDRLTVGTIPAAHVSQSPRPAKKRLFRQSVAKCEQSEEVGRKHSVELKESCDKTVESFFLCCSPKLMDTSENKFHNFSCSCVKKSKLDMTFTRVENPLYSISECLDTDTGYSVPRETVLQTVIENEQFTRMRNLAQQNQIPKIIGKKPSDFYSSYMTLLQNLQQSQKS